MEGSMVEKISRLERFDELEKLLTYNLNNFKEKYPKVLGTDDNNLYLIFDGIEQFQKEELLTFELFAWWALDRSNFITRQLSDRIERSTISKDMSELSNTHSNFFGMAIFIALNSKDTKSIVFKKLLKKYPDLKHITDNEEEKQQVLKSCLVNDKEIDLFFDKIKKIDLSKLYSIFDQTEEWLKKITVIDETPIKELHSNSGRSKNIVFKTQKEKYKLHCHAESYDFQSLVSLYIWSELNKNWNIVKTTNPMKEHNFKFSVSKQHWSDTNFDSIIWDYIKFIEKFEA